MHFEELKLFTDIISNRFDAQQSIWNIFYTVSAATIAIIVSDKLKYKSKWIVPILVTFGFSLFAAGNYNTLFQIRSQRQAIVEIAKGDTAIYTDSIFNSTSVAKQKSSEFVQMSAPPSLLLFRVYHWGLSFVVLSIIWGVSVFKIPVNPNPEQKD
jgi:hypothetical protein